MQHSSTHTVITETYFPFPTIYSHLSLAQANLL